MYKSLLITITFLLSSAALADQAEITKIYNAYVKERTSLIASSYTKQNIAEKLLPFEKIANESYEKITTLEANEKLELSPEGTQLALDGELLTPLSTLAKSAMTADDCGGNKSEAAENGSDEVMGAFVIKTLKQLCK